MLLYCAFLFCVTAKASGPVVSTQHTKDSVDLQCELQSADPHIRVKWYYGSGKEIVHNTSQSIAEMHEGLFDVKSHLTIRLSSEHKICCSVTGADLHAKLVTCTDILKNSEGAEMDDYSKAILPLWCTIAIIIIGLFVIIICLTIAQMVPKLCIKKREVKIYQIDISELTTPNDDPTSFLIP